MLVLTRKVEESITIGNHITVSILEVRGNQVKLGIKAPKDVPINRTEIFENIINENINASATPMDLDVFQGQLKMDKGDKSGEA